MAIKAVKNLKAGNDSKAAKAPKAIKGLKAASDSTAAAEPTAVKAPKAVKDPEEKKGTRRLPVFLSEEHIAWLKKDSKGASAAVRALIAEAMAMENLAKSVGKKAAPRKKK
jgi:hypothetical protein